MATGIDPGGHHFVVLYVSINKKSVFFSEVVAYKKLSLLKNSFKIHILFIKKNHSLNEFKRLNHFFIGR